MSLHDHDELLQAARIVAAEVGLELRPVPPTRFAELAQDEVQEVARASKVRARRVLLRGKWWRSNAGPLLAFRSEDGAPVALVQPTPGRYDLVSGEAGRSRVTAETASRLKSAAYMFLPSFGDQPVGPVALWRLGRRGTWGDLTRVLSVTAVTGLLALATPVIAQLLVDHVIPHSRGDAVTLVAASLVVFALVVAALGFVRGLGMLRLESQMELNMEAALMDRLLRLPSQFFRRYQAGALAQRVLGIIAIRKALSGSELIGILSGVFSVASLMLIFYYDVRLALLGVALGCAVVGVIVGGSLITLRYRRQIEAERGAIAGLLLQLLGGISKLRVAAAERRAFAIWAERFAELTELSYRAGSVANSLGAFRAGYPVLTSLLFFGAVYLITAREVGGPGNLSTGEFFAVITAFGQFLTGVMGLGVTVVYVLGVVPHYERLKPILESTPESSGGAMDPGELTGAVDVVGATFRYDERGPLILHNVSISATPGEMVALVGPSGSGKSTLLRLLLGLERLEAGTISYDGRDFAILDAEAIRRQVGVVLQGGRLTPGDLLSNIVGQWKLTLDDAWEAARKVGLEEDIRAMPMAMHTPVGDAMSTFSAGQQQRLRIARAIVHGPSILFLDEATSALDNRTQDVVAQSLKQMKMTRIVIAHRLSTIRHADRIYYLENGRVIEQGNYDSLMDTNGAFAELARRQLVDHGG